MIDNAERYFISLYNIMYDKLLGYSILFCVYRFKITKMF